jgi:YVTN family beta-propeller protein
MPYIKTLFLSVFFVLLLFSCKKDKIEDPKTVAELSNGILVLNEGLFQMNNSSLSWINLSDLSVDNSFFENKVGRKLGDTGNDLKRYGNKIYVLVNVSSTLEVLDATTGKSIKQISFVEGNQTKEPRSIAFFGAKAFVSCFDGFVDVIDTATLTVEKRIAVGLNPDQIVASNDKIYVSNSGGLNAPVMDSTISVINPNTLLEEQKVVVGKNPGKLVVSNGYLFVHQRGNFGSIPSLLKKINLTTNTVVETYAINPIAFEELNGYIYIVYDDNGTIKFGKFDVFENSFVSTNLVDVSNIETLYGIHVESKNNHIYLFDAHGYTVSGEVLEYDSNGVFIRKFTVGLNPNSIIVF